MCNASQFLDFYLGKLKDNGVQSYRRVFPRAKYQSAKTSAMSITLETWRATDAKMKTGKDGRY